MQVSSHHRDRKCTSTCFVSGTTRFLTCLRQAARTISFGPNALSFPSERKGPQPREQSSPGLRRAERALAGGGAGRGRARWHRARGARRVPRAQGRSEGSLPSLLIQDFAQKALWGLEQQRMHHTVFKTSSFKSKLFKKRIQFLIRVRYRDAEEPYLLEGHMVYRWWRVPRGAVGGICFLNTQKAQPQAVINTSKVI